jgi:hypothetical protein
MNTKIKERIKKHNLADAYLDTLNCHIALWREGTVKREIYTNTVYNADSQFVGYIDNDFSLNSIQWIKNNIVGE